MMTPMTVNPPQMIAPQFAGNRKKTGVLAGVAAAAALALTGCAGGSSADAGRPVPNISTQSDWVDLGKDVSCKTVDTEGHKILLCDGYESADSAPFPKGSYSPTGLTQESAWQKEGKDLACKTITLDGGDFFVCDGYSAVTVQPLDKG